MEKKRLSLNFTRLSQMCLGIAVLTVLLPLGAASTNAATNDDAIESTSPVLISTPESTRALAANAGNWRGFLPKKNSEVFQPDAHVVVFVANVNLLPEEGANAFRAYAEDAAGTKYRFVVENIQPLNKQDGIYALTIRIFDAGGYNDQPKPNGDVLLRVSWRGNTSNRVRLGLGTTGGKIKDDAGAVPTPMPSAPAARPVKAARFAATTADRKRFMEQAAFGPSAALDFRLRQLGFNRWIEEQFNLAYPTIPYPNFPLVNGDGVITCGGIQGTSPEIDHCLRTHYYNYSNPKWMIQEALYGDDQLRRRISWALHQIWVVSHANVGQQRGTQEYIEILDNNAFGNYRDLMKQMTLSPAMGDYLDMIRSTRQNPNENYPRELLQLFTIGLYQLNQDGTLILDNQGNRIPTYDQDKVDQFTKVFTGWVHCNNGANPACPNAVTGVANWIDPVYLANPNNHDQSAKTLFNYPGAPNTAIPACANCTNDANRIVYANDSLNKTLDNIFYHPNVAPFVGKLMIQHLVTSDPSPAFVSRVAAAFNNNGAGTRGDMKAVVRAILLDPEARGSRKTDPTYGKLREPLQYLTNFLRTFGARASTPIMINGVLTPPPTSCQNKSDGVKFWDIRPMGQNIWEPDTVFSYFAPDYVVPGTDTLGPEFALANTGTSFERNNQVMGLSFGWGWFEHATTANPYPGMPCGTSLNRSEPIAWATADPSGNTLIENLNQRMMHGTMSEAMKSKIRAAINFNVSAEAKASQALFLTASSSQYQIQR